MWILDGCGGGSVGKFGLRRSVAHLGLALIATQSVAAPALAKATKPGELIEIEENDDG